MHVPRATLMAVTLLALATALPAGDATASSALGTSCAGTGTMTCTFTCAPGDQVSVRAHDGPQSVLGVCDARAASCSTTGECTAWTNYSTPFSSQGTCTGVGVGTFACWAS